MGGAECAPNGVLLAPVAPKGEPPVTGTAPNADLELFAVPNEELPNVDPADDAPEEVGFELLPPKLSIGFDTVVPLAAFCIVDEDVPKGVAAGVALLVVLPKGLLVPDDPVLPPNENPPEPNVLPVVGAAGFAASAGVGIPLVGLPTPKAVLALPVFPPKLNPPEPNPLP